MTQTGPSLREKFLPAWISKSVTPNSPANIIVSSSITDRFVLFILFFSKTAIYLISTILLITGIVFLTGGRINNNSLILWIAVAIALCVLVWEFRRFFSVAVSTLSVFILLTLLIFASATFLTANIYDKSWDGMAYHQIGILELSKGWNPFFEELPPQVQQSKYFDRTINLMIWVNHYGKGLETFAAVLMGTTNNIESGKVFHVLLFLSSFCYALYFFIRSKLLTNAWAIALAVVAVVNPITINQLFSYYIDGAIGALLLLLILQFAQLIRKDEKKENIWPELVTLFFINVILVTIKFTGFVYMAWLSFIFACLITYLKKTQLIVRFLGVTAFSCLAAIFIAGFNPYVTNTLRQGHPFYPIAGKNKVDVIVHMMPTPLEGHNRFEKLLMSTFSKTDNAPKNNGEIQYKIPLSVSVQEIKALQSEGVRLGGFGVLWSGILCLSVLLFFYTIFKIQRGRLYSIALLAGILGTVLINPAAWWARFIPQFWLFPVVVIVYAILNGKRGASVAGKTLIILMIINSAIIGASYGYSVYASTAEANRVFKTMRNNPRPVVAYFDIFTPNEKKLEANNVPFVKVTKFNELPCSEPRNILKIDFCP